MALLAYLVKQYLAGKSVIVSIRLTSYKIVSLSYVAELPNGSISLVTERSFTKSLLFFTSHVPKTLANVEKSEIWLSTPRVFNDLFDCAVDLYLDEINFGIDDILEDSIQKRCLGKEGYRNTVCIRCFQK